MEAAARDVGGRVSAGRLLRAGLLAVLAAVMVNLIIRTLAVALFGLSEFLPLAVGPTVVFTVVGVLGAVAVFALMAEHLATWAITVGMLTTLARRE